ncbi:ferritin-like domain-containing protein [Acidimicrobiia bacterium EGI L10123]|uniref:ferritin-like domain-containing protein n=1 Tax=Salinilacustrithrix flava TaxID=2957203 RepID=UPI003D7C22E8|nr:ferritin-like domain-containing protein [Acidimicrobiia bacterium EGI L10123]
MTADDAPRSRRDLLRLGGMTVVVGALLASCSSDDDPPAPAPEDETEETRSDVAPTGGADLDVRLLNTALSLEVLVVATYQASFDLGFIQSGPATDAVTLFQQHHGEHQSTLVAAVEAAGAEPFLTPNPVVKAGLVDPTMLSVTAERDFLRLARDLEQASTQLYVHATTRLSTQALRSTAMSVSGVAARRASILGLLGDLSSERLAFVPTDNPLPTDAVVTD